MCSWSLQRAPPGHGGMSHDPPSPATPRSKGKQSARDSLTGAFGPHDARNLSELSIWALVSLGAKGKIHNCARLGVEFGGLQRLLGSQGCRSQRGRYNTGGIYESSKVAEILFSKLTGQENAQKGWTHLPVFRRPPSSPPTLFSTLADKQIKVDSTFSSCQKCTARCLKPAVLPAFVQNLFSLNHLPSKANPNNTRHKRYLRARWGNTR